MRVLLKKLDVMPTAIFFSLLGFFISVFLIGILYLALFLAKLYLGSMANMYLGFLTYGIFEMIIWVVINTLLYFIFGAFLAVIYNIYAGMSGGLRIDFIDEVFYDKK